MTTPNKRDAAKARTRSKLKGVAHKLFEQQGYEATTIRGIAAAAHMSTGAVFSNWPSKAELWFDLYGVPAPPTNPLARYADALADALRALLDSPNDTVLRNEARALLEAAGVYD